MIHSNQIAPFTIIKVKGYNHVLGIILILAVEIVSPGYQVGVKLGEPVEIGSDGNILPDLMEAKLTALR